MIEPEGWNEEKFLLENGRPNGLKIEGHGPVMPRYAGGLRARRPSSPALQLTVEHPQAQHVKRPISLEDTTN